MALAANRVLVGIGSIFGDKQSHSTRMLSPPRKGSAKIATGCKSTSESLPGAWPVELPSKFHTGSSATLVGLLDNVFVFWRISKPPVVLLPPNHTYSARTLPFCSRREDPSMASEIKQLHSGN